MPNYTTYNIKMVKGDTESFGFEVTGIDSLDTAFFSCKRNSQDTNYLFQKSLGAGITQSTESHYIVRIAPEDTQSLAPGQYWYDLDIGKDGDIFTILRGVLELVPKITEPDAVVFTSVDWGNIVGNIQNQSDLQAALNAKATTSSLAQVATTGSYDDLTDTPSIPTKTSELTNDSDYVVESNLAAVATSGSYSDLLNRPTTLTDLTGVLPINQGGTNATDVVSARTNLEVYKEYVLYNNSSGSNGTINLSDSVTNYVKLGIYFRTLNPSSSDFTSNVYSYQEIYISTLSDFYFLLSIVRSNHELYLNFCSAIAKLELSSFVLFNNRSFYIEVQGSNRGPDSYQIYVTRVVGYKY